MVAAAGAARKLAAKTSAEGRYVLGCRFQARAPFPAPDLSHPQCSKSRLMASPLDAFLFVSDSSRDLHSSPFKEYSESDQFSQPFLPGIKVADGRLHQRFDIGCRLRPSTEPSTVMEIRIFMVQDNRR